MKKEMQPVAEKDEIIVYQPEGGEFHIVVRVENETVWLTQAQMAELFGTAPQNITIHIKNIYEEGELFKVATCKDFLQVAREGNRNVKRNYKYYNLDVIISVGYRVKSIQGTRFRQWALQVLKNHMLKGYSINRRLLASQSLPAEIVHVQQQLIEKQGSEIENIKHSVDTRLSAVEQRVDFFVNTAHSVKKLSSEVQKIKENFIDPTTYKHFLILDGQKLESDVAFTKIYSMAKKTIIIIDNYVGVKTLDLLRGIAKNASVQIFSEELNGKITPAIKADYEKARPDVSLKIDRPNRKFHDRYVFLDYGTRSEKLFHCGASSKDGGNKITTIMQIECPEMYHPIVEELKKVPAEVS